MDDGRLTSPVVQEQGLEEAAVWIQAAKELSDHAFPMVVFKASGRDPAIAFLATT